MCETKEVEALLTVNLQWQPLHQTLLYPFSPHHLYLRLHQPSSPSIPPCEHSGNSIWTGLFFCSLAERLENFSGHVLLIPVFPPLLCSLSFTLSLALILSLSLPLSPYLSIYLSCRVPEQHFGALHKVPWYYTMPVCIFFLLRSLIPATFLLSCPSLSLQRIIAAWLASV